MRSIGRTAIVLEQARLLIEVGEQPCASVDQLGGAGRRRDRLTVRGQLQIDVAQQGLPLGCAFAVRKVPE